METTRFFKTFPCSDQEKQLLLYSTKSACKLLSDRSILTSIEDGTLSDKERSQLSELGFLVPDRDAEAQGMPGVIDTQNDLNTALTVTVVLNLDCNFSCTYCYEGERKGNKYMTGETAEQLLQFIKTRFTDKKDTLVVDFYGGEPLLSIPLIEQISRSLKSFAESRNATYFSTMVTNGSLLKRSVVEKLAGLGLRSAKVTLDGPAHIHDKYRPFRSGAGSFDVILKNVEESCDLITISIGGNLNKDNYHEFVSLLDILEARGLTPDKLGIVKFDPIIDTGETNRTMPEHRGGCISINEPWILDAERLLRKEILKRGYKTPKIGPLLCTIEHRDQFIVNWNGDLYKCPGFLGHEQFVVGNVRTGVEDYSDTYKLDIWKGEPCLNCEYLPMCFGGCRYWTFIRNGKIDGIDCKKPYLDAQLETLVKQDIEYQL
jgi:uncharacterized protein